MADAAGHRRFVALALVLVLAGAAALASCASTSQPPETLQEIYTPSFPRVPVPEDPSTTVNGLREDLAAPAGDALLSRLAPDQAGVLWLALVVALLVAFDFERPSSRRNVDLALMLALGTALFNVVGFFPVIRIPRYWALLDVVFVVIFALNLALLVRAFMRAGAPSITPWTPNLPQRALATVALVLVCCNVLVALTRRPDDAGWFINLGAQRLRERGTLPFGDPMLTGTAGAAYGPVLYVLHVPFQVAVSPRPLNPVSPDRPLDGTRPYYLPPLLATKLCTIALHLLGVFALFHAGRRLGGSAAAGWAVVALYCGSAFVMGVGGVAEFIGGMTFVSHIGPAALTLAAFAALPRPAAAGALLAVAGGAGFYPVFFAPAWAGFYSPRRSDFVRFAAGFAAAGLVVFGMTLALSRPANGRSRVGTLLHDTFGHHTDPASYGRSPFGFWGQRDGIRGWIARPITGTSGLAAPAFIAFAALCAAAFFRARGRSAARLALVTGALALGASMIKIHATGCYVAWAYPFLLLGFLLDGRDKAAAESFT